MCKSNFNDFERNANTQRHFKQYEIAVAIELVAVAISIPFHFDHSQLYNMFSSHLLYICFSVCPTLLFSKCVKYNYTLCDRNISFSVEFDHEFNYLLIRLYIEPFSEKLSFVLLTAVISRIVG